MTLRVCNLRVYLIGGVSADHMVNGKMASWMLVEPVVEFQGKTLVDDNELAICDETLDLTGGYEAVPVHT